MFETLARGIASGNMSIILQQFWSYLRCKRYTWLIVYTYFVLHQFSHLLTSFDEYLGHCGFKYKMEGVLLW